MLTSLTLRRPDDFHLHLRTGEMLELVLPHTARQCARAIVMPNLLPPVTTVEMAASYRDEIMQALPEALNFTPLMTLYLTDNTSPEEIQKAKESGFVHAVKLYPAGATTHSDSGVTDVAKVYPVLEAMQQHDLPLLVHSEVTDTEVDIFDREKVFIDRILSKIVTDFPQLRLVMEHLTTKDGVEFVSAQSKKVAATLTAHHLLCNRNDLLVGGIKPHYYCLPILKSEEHRRALVEAATSGNPKFFAGTDSAPHLQNKKENDCGCAGCYTAYHMLPLYAEVFDRAGKLDKLEAFVSEFGAKFYGLPLNEGSIILERGENLIPQYFEVGSERLVPFWGGKELGWRYVESRIKNYE